MTFADDLALVLSAGQTLIAEDAALYALVHRVGKGREFFVNALTGNDANDGSQVAPWQTKAKVNAAPLPHGDRVLFASDQRFIGPALQCKAGVTYTTYGDDPAILDGGLHGPWVWTEANGLFSMPFNFDKNEMGVWDEGLNYAYARGATQAFMQAHPGAYWNDTVSAVLWINPIDGRRPPADLIISHHSGADVNSVNLANGTWGILIDGLDFEYGIDGLFVDGKAAHVEMQYSAARHCSYYGVESYGPYTHIHDSVFERCGEPAGGGGVTLSGATSINSLVEDNQFLDNGGHPLLPDYGHSWGGGAQVSDGASGAIIRRNFCRQRNDLIGSVGYNAEGGAALIDHNISVGGQWGAYTADCKSAQIRYNTFVDFVSSLDNTLYPAGIYVGGGSKAVEVTHNLISSLHNPQGRIFAALAYLPTTLGQLTPDDYNLMWLPNAPTARLIYTGAGSTYKSWAQWQAINRDLHGLNVDPQLTSDYHTAYADVGAL